ncbi:unnamed protein product [Oikopleura dioica]|uniref:Galactosylceramide sulfotransferase-like n=1 Tax=Oikopleura dioica TaxID=34765 RepID=E4X7G4_OIKDI|nr:unnamed protein product [Oikopleura dioica]
MSESVSFASDSSSSEIEHFNLSESERPMSKTRRNSVKKSKGRWDSKYFITILCFMLVLMINIHLLMNKKGALADYLFDSPVGVPTVQHEELINHPKVYQRPVLPSCEGVPRRNLVFTKTHKTGGTTLTNILLRYAEKHHLVTGLPFGSHWELAGYPGLFDTELIDPILPKYNLMCHHFRYGPDVKKVTHPDHVFITMLRDPVGNFESEFGFFRDYPFPQWVGENGTIIDFMKNPIGLYNKQTPWYMRGKNYMSFDLGLEHESESASYIESAIEELEQTYHFVLLTDYFEESLILLKELMCMTDEDLVYLQLKTRTERVAVDPVLSEKIRSWNKLDTAIYDHFLAVFNEKIKAFGTTRMAQEVMKLRRNIAAVKQQCVESVDTQREHSWIQRNVLRKGSPEHCRKMNWGEVKYGDHIRELQRSWTSIPPQPALNLRENKLRATQIEILGEEVFQQTTKR